MRATVLSNLDIEPLTANKGQACATRQAGINTPPGLPLALSLNALYARTALDGPAGNSGAQVARAESGVADVAVGTVPDLQLPTPDLGITQLPITVPLIGTITVDLRPALEALLQPLPNASLLHAEAVESAASAQCVNGQAHLTGSAKIVGLEIGGRSFGFDQPVTETIQLIDTQHIDPSDIDLAKVILPSGVNLSAVQAVLDLVLDTLPTIEVPATVAQVKVTPKRQIRTGDTLTQHALDAHVSIGAVTLADLVVAESTVSKGDVVCPQPPNNNPPNNNPPNNNNNNPPSGSQRPPGASAVDQALACSSRPLALIDVVTRGNRVRLVGAADRRFAGQRVAIKFLGNGKTVARPTVSASGLFRASAKLPARSIRNTNRARYQASIGKDKSLPLKLVRRVVVTGTRLAGGRVTMTGRLLRPLPARPRPILVKQRVSCDSWKTVGRARASRSGKFRVTVTAPARGSVMVLRIQTQVAASWTKRNRLTPTFSLPRFVEG